MCGYFSTGFIDFMLVGKKVTYFTGMFSPYHSKKNDDIFLSYFNDKINFPEQKKFRLRELIETENYFHQEINQRKPCSKKLSK